MGEIVTVNFRGDELYGFKQADGVVLAVKPMCEAMGIPYDGQRQRIARDPILSKAASNMLVPFVGKGQQVTCLRLNDINLWLRTINSSQIKDEAVRARVFTYQRECYLVLQKHFSSQRQPATGDAHEGLSFDEKICLVAEARDFFGIQAAREMWFKQGLPITPSMLSHGENVPLPRDMIRSGDLAEGAA